MAIRVPVLEYRRLLCNIPQYAIPQLFRMNDDNDDTHTSCIAMNCHVDWPWHWHSLWLCGCHGWLVCLAFALAMALDCRGKNGVCCRIAFRKLSCHWNWCFVGRGDGGTSTKFLIPSAFAWKLKTSHRSHRRGIGTETVHPPQQAVVRLNTTRWGFRASDLLLLPRPPLPVLTCLVACR